MEPERQRYEAGHWLRSHDSEKAFASYMDQQSKAYSKVKNEYIRELLGDLRGKAVLDYGCGGGMFTVHAAKEAAAGVVGIDAEESALDIARHFARIEGVESMCEFIQAQRFPDFKSGTHFDTILLKDVIEHVHDDRDLLTAAARIIAPAGRIVISTQNRLSLNYLLEGTYHRVIRGDRNWFGWDPTHLRFYTALSLHRKLTEAGFIPWAWRSVYLVPYKLPALPSSNKQFTRIDPLAWVDRVLGAVFPYSLLGWNIIVMARAPGYVAQPVAVQA